MSFRILSRARRAGPAFSVLGVLLLAACGNPGQQGPVTGAGYTRSAEPPGPPSDPWGPWIREASQRFDVPEAWIREVMRQESGGRAHATSPVGAMGLMQVMPATYRELRTRHGLGSDPYHPYDNIMAGTAYLRQMYEMFGSPSFLAAYNAGPGRLQGFLDRRHGLPAETRNYVASVGPAVLRYSPAQRAPQHVYASAAIPLRVAPGLRRNDAATQRVIAQQAAIRERSARSAPATMLASAPAPSRAPAPAPAPTPVRAPAGSLLASAGNTPAPVARIAPAPSPAAPAAGGPPAAGQRLPDGRIVVASMAPIPDGSTPQGAARLAASQPAAPQPPQAPSPAARGFGLIGTAQASTLPANFRTPARAARTPRPGRWAIQVGAFNSPAQARRAAGTTQRRTGGMVQVTPVQVGNRTLFRARIVGLTEATARQNCTSVSGRGGCMLIAPEA